MVFNILMTVEEYATYRYNSDMIGLVIVLLVLFACFIFWIIDKNR